MLALKMKRSIKSLTLNAISLARLAEQGHAKAQYNLGVLYSKGIVVGRDFKEAAKWYQRAAEQGHAKAQYNIGVLYSKGIGVHRDSKEAGIWYRMAAEQGFDRAQLTLGYLYEYGEGVPQDSKEATEWYRMAAEQGNPDAQLNVGYQYEFAYGVSRDFKEAIKWYRRAAEQGDEEAQYNLEQLRDKDLEIAGASVEAGKLPLEAPRHGEIKDRQRTELSKDDRLIDPNAPFPSINKWIYDISQKFAKKSEQAQKVFMLRIGMLGSPPKTLEKIGEKIGITKERVRQIVNKMERSGRHPMRKKWLQPLIIKALEIVDSRGGKIDNTTLVSLLLSHGPDGEMLKFATPFIDFMSSLPEWANSGLKIGENGVLFTDKSA